MEHKDFNKRRDQAATKGARGNRELCITAIRMVTGGKHMFWSGRERPLSESLTIVHGLHY